jgi:hypothetical protein
MSPDTAPSERAERAGAAGLEETLDHTGALPAANGNCIQLEGA